MKKTDTDKTIKTDIENNTSNQFNLTNSIDKISLVMQNEEKNFNNIKTSPKNRWYNSSMSFLLASIFALLGVMVICLIIYFN
ncbi:hypothetical protein D8X55_01440 [Malacoplasma penetrans]|uniref:Uncharacterized protein n=1 Tax=Malacoplasma penetrans (strain HF-2) TaxID=272633 RepID=Q8EUK3_MALP2|nr:hypothetical protein [Malacoplasma penetrans]RXY97123.1 hypothetical protein D8X55_01440 [Malacoplasma penetrans]BAC44709.1 hypothetical protein [Malacoplasma penetrans HF-2]